MDIEKDRKTTVYKVSVNCPGGPIYYVTKEDLLEELQKKLTKTYKYIGPVTVTKFERNPPPVEAAM